ncbi:hypothetical protein BASA81_001606 [Batrachochytrium salamandrivorans]|nr:hypothetical protein BASA81_001606 [Batrachochytrium salamandrivorans]
MDDRRLGRSLMGEDALVAQLSSPTSYQTPPRATAGRKKPLNAVQREVPDLENDDHSHEARAEATEALYSPASSVSLASSSPPASKLTFAFHYLNNVGAGFNLTVMGLILESLSSLPNSELGSEEVSMVAGAGFLGALSGQIIMGFLGDVLGRPAALVLTTVLIIGGAIASSALEVNSKFFLSLAICRFVTCLGVGGVYPLTATSSSEESSKVSPTLLVFSGQGVGQLLVPLMVLLLDGQSAAVWRATLGLGAFPSVLGLALFSLYNNVVFAQEVLARIVQGSSQSSIAGPNSIVLLVGLFGYVFSYLFIDRLGLRRLQMMGFLILTVLYGVLALTFEVLPPVAMFALYALTFFFSNFGPNATTFCLPSKTFPVQVRSTFNGISAGLGKLGAFVGIVLFPLLKEKYNIEVVLGFSAAVAFMGFLATYLLVFPNDDAAGGGEEKDTPSLAYELVHHHHRHPKPVAVTPVDAAGIIVSQPPPKPKIATDAQSSHHNPFLAVLNDQDEFYDSKA